MQLRTARITARMSQNNPTILYAGLDVAKASLQLSLGERSYCLSNDGQGHTRLVKLLRAAGTHAQVHLVLEATGGYEAAAVGALHQADITLSVTLPSRVRAFAKAKGCRAKTDPIDASMLAAFGAAIKPAPTAPPTAAQLLMRELTTRRAQLVQTRVAEENRAAHYLDKGLLRQSRQLLALLEKQIASCEEQLAAVIAADEATLCRAKRLQLVAGVGPIISALLLAEMPELGTLNSQEAAALAGLAPYNSDSGPRHGPRHIHGGRASVRCALYLAAMNAVRHDRILREFYQRLRDAGKKPIVALTAAMRKLVVLLNRLLKNPHFQLVS
jgi:transposase